MMENLFLRVVTVSLAVSVLLAPLLLCRGRLEKKYAPQTRWALWLAVALVLLIAPWLPKPQAPVVVEAPAYTVTLPVRPVERPQTPAKAPAQNGVTGQPGVQDQAPAGTGQSQAAAPGQPASPADPAAPVEPQTAQAQRPTVSVTTLAAAVWLAGMAVVLLWQGGRYRLLRRRLLSVSRPVSGLEGYARELGLAGKVTFCECQSISGPMTLGLFRSVVLLPETGVAPAALRHELYHIKRHDVAYKALLLLACALHWFDPLVWLMARAADRDVEACCDAAVVAGQDKSYRRSYGELLLSAAGEGGHSPFATSFGGGAEQMKARLTQLFRPGKRSRALVCGLLAAAVLLSSLVACQEKTVEPDSGDEIPGNVLYTNDTYGFTLALPESWAGNYTAVEQEGEVSFRYQENDQPLMTLHITTTASQQEGWALMGIYNYFVYAELTETEEDAPWAVLAEDMKAQIEDGVGVSWLEVSYPLTENTMPHLDYYDPESGFLVYHTRTDLYVDAGVGRGSLTYGKKSQGEQWEDHVIDMVDVRPDSGEIYGSDCASDGSDIRYFKVVLGADGIGFQALDEPFTPQPIEPLQSADPALIFGMGMYQPSHNYTLWSNALELADGTLAALAVDGTIEGGGTMDALEMVRMGEDWWEENRLLTPEKLFAPVDYASMDWGFTLHLPECFEGRYLVQRNYNAYNTTSWAFYDKEQWQGPNGNGFLFTLYARDAETFRSEPHEDVALKEQNGIIFTMTTWPHREEGYSEGYLELLEAAEGITGDDLDLSQVTRFSSELWPLADAVTFGWQTPVADRSQTVILRSFGDGDYNGVDILARKGDWVVSAAAGTVVEVRETAEGYYTVVVKHEDGTRAYYGHLAGAWVSEGEEVLRGQGVGYVAEEDGQSWLALAWNVDGTYRDPLTTPVWQWNSFEGITEQNFLFVGDQHIPAALRSTLRGETTFYNVEDQEYQYVDALPFSDDIAVKAIRFTEVDMDNDGIPEVVLWLDRGGSEYLLGSIVLRYQNGWVYGYPMGYRSLELKTLKADGTYNWSGGAFNWGWGRLDFAARETRDISWCQGAGGADERYYVDRETVTAEEFQRAGEAQDAKEDAVWVELTEENIALVY